MNHKSLLVVLIPLAAVILQLAPTVHGCLNFYAAYPGDPSGDPTNSLFATIWDLGGLRVCWDAQDATVVNNVFTFTCINGISATFEVDTRALHYHRGVDHFDMTVEWNSYAQRWYHCEYGCDIHSELDCFVG